MSESSDYYVYVYIDPRNFEEFYYGKGTRDRKYAHLNDENDNEKTNRIKEIREAGLEPIIKVIAKDLTETEAFLVEKTLIWKLGRTLTNVSSGRFVDKFRPHNKMHMDLYSFDYHNGIYYFNVGEGPHRTWIDCKRYGFLSAGQGKIWGEQIQALREGDVVVAYLSKKGYVGVGVVIERAVIAKDFRIDGKRLDQLDLVSKRMMENADDPEKAEYLARVEWKASCNASEAKWVRNKGLFTTRMARASLQNQKDTIDFVSSAFNIDLESLLRKKKLKVESIMNTQLSLTVNGKKYSLPSLAGEMLASLLRERLNLTGTKIGCEEAECGTCTVLVDGEPVLSCIYPAARANGKEIVTVEGLAQNGRLHALQEAFIQHGAVQCGFCIPGQLITAYALLKRNPNPSREDIRYALKDTLCRCAGYPTIENSILAAAQSLKTGEPIAPPKIQLSAEKYQVIGQIVARPDAEEKVTGRAKFSDDLKFDGMLYAAVKRAGIPHGFLHRLDISKARALPGVVAVLTADDIPGEHNHGLVIYDWPAIVGMNERVRYVGNSGCDRCCTNSRDCRTSCRLD